MTRSQHQTWRRTPKRGYTTQQEALDAIPTAASNPRIKEPTAYRCSLCDQWHIGNESILPEWPLRKRGATIALATPAIEDES